MQQVESTQQVKSTQQVEPPNGRYTSTYKRDGMTFISNGMEDSILINRDAIERGFFRSQSLKKYYQNLTLQRNP